MPDITIRAKDGGTFTAYAAMPEKLPAPAVLVIQEIFGVTPDLRAKCDTLAGQGFIAVCPDLFWRLEPGVVLEPRDEADLQKAYGLMNRFDVNQGVEDLTAVVDMLRTHEKANGRVGVIGFCLGGKLAYLMACRSSVDGAVPYYGGGIDQLLDEAKTIKRPVLLHFAEEDKHIDKTAQGKIRAGLQDHPLVTLQFYPGVDHAFTRQGGQNYDDAAAKLADSRTLEFLQANLLDEKTAALGSL